MCLVTLFVLLVSVNCKQHCMMKDEKMQHMVMEIMMMMMMMMINDAMCVNINSSTYIYQKKLNTFSIG